MWILRIALAVPLIILLSREIPQFVHNLTPFEAKSIETRNITVKFARSRMIDFFQYQITYDLKVLVNPHPYRTMFGVVDTINNKFDIYLSFQGSRYFSYDFVTTFNASITTIGVPELQILGYFLREHDHNKFSYLQEGFNLDIPGAEPHVNPLFASVVTIYMLAVICGFCIELLMRRQFISSYSKMENDQEEEEREESTFRDFKNNSIAFLYWAVLVAVIETLVIFFGVKTGLLPDPFR